MAETNGINMLDVKKKNRGSILRLIYQKGSISRKEIATALGLTPAAITLITNDLIEEGLLEESSYESSNVGRKGRKEILLEIRGKKFAAIGVYISKHKFRIMCMDLKNTIPFEDTVLTADCYYDSSKILAKLCQSVTNLLADDKILHGRTLLGMGVCVNGIVKSRQGISVKSYGIWEENVQVIAYLEEALQIPIILTNNICALAHGEAFLSRREYLDNMLFIKYGPGVGAARLNYRHTTHDFDYKAIELGHLIVEPDGLACICGNHGCLETIASYSSIERSISEAFSKENTPILYELLDGNPEKFTIEALVEAYEQNDPPIVKALEKVIRYLSLAIKNSICILEPSSVILYGELFESARFREVLNQNLKLFSVSERVSFSHFNLELETIGPAYTIINRFFELGGHLL